jgi:hypothetical protein
MVFSRSSPQQVGQISSPSPGQYRRARFFSHSLQGAFTEGFPLSYHRGMVRTDVYLKVEVVLDEKEPVERVAAEICRQIRRLHGVRQAEVLSTVDRD